VLQTVSTIPGLSFPPAVKETIGLLQRPSPQASGARDIRFRGWVFWTSIRGCALGEVVIRMPSHPSDQKPTMLEEPRPRRVMGS